MNSFWLLIVTYPRFSTIPSNFSQFPLRLVSKSLNLSNQLLNFAAWLSYLSGLSMSFDIDRFELVVIVRAGFDLRVLHDAQLVLQFFDSGHEVLDHRGLVLLKIPRH